MLRPLDRDICPVAHPVDVEVDELVVELEVDVVELEVDVEVLVVVVLGLVGVKSSWPWPFCPEAQQPGLLKFWPFPWP